jgi:hypothetical protein
MILDEGQRRRWLGAKVQQAQGLSSQPETAQGNSVAGPFGALPAKTGTFLEKEFRRGRFDFDF